MSPRSSNSIVPTNEQIRFAFFDPIRCFCGKPAYIGYTLEYGPILQCGRLGTEASEDQKTKFVCGFHVHENSWLSFRAAQLKKPLFMISLDYSELRTCPLYNFSYCAMFRVINNYALASPIELPQCFCRRPAVMCINHKNGIQFACQKASIDGASKCNWKLPAKEVAFPSPKHRIHRYVDKEKYIEMRERLRKVLLSEHIDKEHRQREKYRNDSLDALSASSTTQESPPLASSMTMAKEDQDQDNVISFEDLTLQEQGLQAEGSATSKTWIVPTCMLSDPNKTNQKQAQLPQSVPSFTLSNLSSSSTTNWSIMSSQNPSDEIRTLRMTCHPQRSIIEQQKEVINQERGKLQTEAFNSSQNLEDEISITQNCQKRLSDLEIDLIRLEIEEEELIEAKNKLAKVRKLNRCIVCYTYNIEYCLVPCYHYGKLSFFFFFV